jgi:hypothetical protein
MVYSMSYLLKNIYPFYKHWSHSLRCSVYPPYNATCRNAHPNSSTCTHSEQTPNMEYSVQSTKYNGVTNLTVGSFTPYYPYAITRIYYPVQPSKGNIMHLTSTPSTLPFCLSLEVTVQPRREAFLWLTVNSSALGEGSGCWSLQRHAAWVDYT